MVNEVLQIGLVCRDAMAMAKRYNDEYGIGPWRFMRFDEETTSGLEVRGKPCPYKILIGICSSLNVDIELIEPLDDKSIYHEFLERHGEGIHHIAVDTVDGCDETTRLLEALGNTVLCQGYNKVGRKFLYMDCMDSLGMLVEMYGPKLEGGKRPEPLAYYPPKE